MNSTPSSLRLTPNLKILHHLLCFIAASSAVMSARAHVREFVLAQDGRAAATIVTATPPSDNARAAAKELQSYVRRMSGAELPVVGDDQSPSGPLILVGPSRFTDQIPGLQIPSGLTRELREEGFVI